MPQSKHIELGSAGIKVQRFFVVRVLAWIALGAALILPLINPGFILVSIYGSPLYLILLFEGYKTSYVPPRFAKAKPARILAREGELLILDGDATLLRIPRSDIKSGWNDAYGNEHKVVLAKKNGDRIWIAVPSEEEGRSILRVLGLTEEQDLLHFGLASLFSQNHTANQRSGFLILAWILVFPLLTGASFLYQAGPMGIALGVVIALIAAIQFLRWISPRVAIVGTDGVVIRNLGTRTFVAYADISRVYCNERGVYLERFEGSPILLATGPNTGRPGELNPPTPATQALYERLVMAKQKGQLGQDSSAALSLLERGGRSLQQWMNELRALAQRDGSVAGYRTRGIDREELAAVVMDSGTSSEHRIAAAIALGASRDPELVARARIAVDTCANERMRVALDKATREELSEAELEALLESEGAEEGVAGYQAGRRKSHAG